VPAQAFRSLARFVHPANLPLIDGFRKVVSERSLQDSMKWVLEAVNVHVRIEAGSFLPSGPQLVIANHPSPIDAPILLSAVDRDDTYFAGSAGIGSFSPELAARLFPMYMSQQPSPYLFTKLKNHVYHRLREGVDRDEAQRRNFDSLQRAARRLSEGATLILTPTGGTFVTTTDWKSGVGFLIQRADANGHVVFTRIEGSTRWDLLRLMNPYWFGPFLKALEVKVRIHEPIPLAEFSKGSKHLEKISEAVKEGYLKAFGSL
jgi:1-acyl-sn-glycerol-3-phosphate acyltransferase